MLLDWRKLVGMSDEELGRLDVAAVNLACAEGLPGAPTPAQVAECIDRLDHYARSVADYTEKRMGEFRSRPDRYDGSLGKFRMVCMVDLLRGLFGVRYNEAKIPEEVPLDTADTFIHGALLGEGGTCASLPVVYTAVGRRLGYPLKLVMTQTKTAGHLFVRWDEPNGERFNFEANNTSCDSPSDDDYRKGREHGPMPPDAERYGCCLVSLSPRQELSDFMAQRGHRWLELGNSREATNSFAWSLSLSPSDRLLRNRLISTRNEWGDKLRRRQPPDFPLISVEKWPTRRFPETLPEGLERDVVFLEAWEFALANPDWDRQFWGPMRRREPIRRPTNIRVFGRDKAVDVGLHFNQYGGVIMLGGGVSNV